MGIHSQPSKMNGCSKLLVGSTSLFGVLALVFVILYATKSATEPDVPDSPTYPAEDVKAAARVLDWMDQTADPCNDFYQYACGGWLEKTELPKSSGRYSTFDDADTAMNKILKKELSKEKTTTEAESIGKAKDFYKECLDKSTIEKNSFAGLQSLVTTLGGWPMADGSSVEKSDVEPAILAKSFYNFATQAAIQPIMSAAVDIDKTDVRLHIASVDQPGLFLGSNSYYVSIEDSEANRDLKNAYIEYVATVAKHYCEDSSSSVSCDDVKIQAAAEMVYDFENVLASIVVDGTTRSSDEDATWSPTTLGAFVVKYPNLGPIVDALLHEMFDPLENVPVVDSDLRMNDASVPFFEKFDQWLVDSFVSPGDDVVLGNIEQMQNFMILRMLADLSFALPEKYLVAEDKLNFVRYGTSERSNREESCINLSNNQLPFPVGAIYVEKAFTAETRAQVFTMIENIINSFNTKILDEQNDWMDDETKLKAHEKSDMVKSYVGYPDYIIDDQAQMDEDYSDFIITEGEFFSALASIRSKKVKEDIKMFGQPTDRDRWGGKVAWVNAFYSPTRNTITIPAGILQDPFLFPGSSTAMNYGGIGMVIGHELTHGFDDSGAQYDGIGNKQDWWSEESLEKFKVRADALAAQYSAYYWDQAQANLNGKFENGENIADNGGIRETFYAYEKWAQDNEDKVLPGLENLSWQQQIFVGYSQVWCGLYTDAEAKRRVKIDVHAPGPFRVLGPLANFDEFSNAFQCNAGDLYFPPNANQTERVRVW